MVPFQQQALGFHVNRASGIQQFGSVTHQNGNLGYAPAIHRSVVVGDSVLTVSDAGLESSGLSTLAPPGLGLVPGRAVGADRRRPERQHRHRRDRRGPDALTR